METVAEAHITRTPSTAGGIVLPITHTVQDSLRATVEVKKVGPVSWHLPFLTKSYIWLHLSFYQCTLTLNKCSSTIKQQLPAKVCRALLLRLHGTIQLITDLLNFNFLQLQHAFPLLIFFFPGVSVHCQSRVTIPRRSYIAHWGRPRHVSLQTVQGGADPEHGPCGQGDS